MRLRPVLLLLLGTLGAGVGLTAPAAALDVPTLPSVTAPTVDSPPLPEPSLPAPTLPAPTVSTSTPALPAPTPTVTTSPALSGQPTVPTTTSSPSAPAPAPTTPLSQVTQTVQSATQSVTSAAAGSTGSGTATGGSAGTAGGALGSLTGTAEPRTGAAAGGGYAAGLGGGVYASLPVSRVPIVASSSSGNAPSAKRPKHPRKIVLGFVSYQRGRLALPVVQISPVCRRAGTIAVNARPGVNLIRFNGRLGRRWLLDGTYVLVTPTMLVRFAVVQGRPTRKKTRFQPSTCREGVDVLLAGGSVPLGAAAAGLAANAPVTVSAGGITDGVPKVLSTGRSGPSRVLGTTIDEVKSAVTGLHPAFFVLLGMAIAALAVATLPASAVPSPWLGATLARRRAELTLAGTTALVTVIVAYLLTVGT